MPTVKIARGTDPFKKYWWVILLGFGGVGGWICLPMMDSSVGSGSVAPREGGFKSEQSLDAINNPTGAPGGAINLSMDGTGPYKKRGGDGPITSSLYQAPEDKAAAASPEAPKPANNLANALKDITKQSAAHASASVDPSGWGGQKAQKGFTAPKAGFGAMSGLAGGSGSGAAAVSGGGGGGTFSGFGSQKANTGVTMAKGLKDDGSGEIGGGKNKSLNALQGAQSASVNAARQQSNDAASAMGGASFDGRGGGGSSINGGGAGGGGGPGVYGSLDAAPANLKVNDPNLDKRTVNPVPTPEKKDATDPNDKMRQMVMQMIIMAVIGGLTGGLTSALGLGAASAAK